MSVTTSPNQSLFQVHGKVKFSSVSTGHQPWKDGSIEIISPEEGNFYCIVKPKYGRPKLFKLSKLTIKSLTVNMTNLMIHLSEGGMIRLQTYDNRSGLKLPKVKNLLEDIMKGELNGIERQKNRSFYLSPTGELYPVEKKTPKNDQPIGPSNVMLTPTSIGKLLIYDGPNSADSDTAIDGLPLFDDVNDLDKENVNSNYRSESVFHKRKESGGSIFLKSYEENAKSQKTPASSTKSAIKTTGIKRKHTIQTSSQKTPSSAAKSTGFYNQRQQTVETSSQKTPSSAVKSTGFYNQRQQTVQTSSQKTPTSSAKSAVKTSAFYSRGKQMLQAASQNFLDIPRRPQLLGSPVKKPRLSDGIYKGWQEKSKIFTSTVNQPKLKGFSNLGNTCYMNAILQSLFSLDPFVEDILNMEVYREMPRESLYKATCQLLQAKRRGQTSLEIQQLLLSVKGAISKTATRFLGYLQHDAHEFLSQCLDQLKEDVLKLNRNAASLKDMENTKRLHRGSDEQNTPSKYPCAISQNFEFTVLHKIQCNKCKEVVTKSETCHDLSLDIPRRRSTLSRISIQTALDQFFQSESLEYTCEECGCKESTVSHCFTKIPRVIILQLKRYSFDMNSANKLTQSVLIPNYMTLARHCTEHSKPAQPQHTRPSQVNIKTHMLSPVVRAEDPERLPRKRLNYESGSTNSVNEYTFKRKRQVDYDSDFDDLPMIDLTGEDNDKSSSTDQKNEYNNCVATTLDKMTEEEQLAFAIEQSRKESARKNTETCEMSEDDQLAMILERSKHETTFTPLSSYPATPKSASTDPIRRNLSFDDSTVRKNRDDSGIGLCLDKEDAEKKSGVNSLPRLIPSNDSGISIRGVEPLAASPELNCLDYADVIMKDNETPKERMSINDKRTHNYSDEAPQNEEDEARALERALQISLQEFEETIPAIRNVESQLSFDDGVKHIVYTNEEEYELEKNYESGHLPNSYKLLSIVSHIGSTSAIGHYVSDAYDSKKSRWLSYDDSEVLQTTVRQVQEMRQKNGYIFFYINNNFCT